MDKQPAGVTGRPRDPLLRRRALSAALDVYAHLGWSGYTFGKVATQARVGKSSLYSRWPTKMDLLIAAFDEFDTFFRRAYDALADLPFADRMRQMIEHRVGMYFTPSGLATIRIQLEYQADPTGMEQVWKRSVGQAILRTRDLLTRAIADGDLISQTSVVHLGDALEGAMVMHAIATPAPLRARALAQLPEYATQLAERTLGPWLTDAARAASSFPKCIIHGH